MCALNKVDELVTSLLGAHLDMVQDQGEYEKFVDELSARKVFTKEEVTLLLMLALREIEVLRRFRKEWSDRFGFLARVNDRLSFESIDEVASLMNSKDDELHEELNSYRAVICFETKCAGCANTLAKMYELEEQVHTLKRCELCLHYHHPDCESPKCLLQVEPEAPSCDKWEFKFACATNKPIFGGG